jgi:hypothetical protein
MTSKSVYCVECICGHHIESEMPTVTCPACQREVQIEWPAREEEHEHLEVKQTLAAA